MNDDKLPSKVYDDTISKILSPIFDIVSLPIAATRDFIFNKFKNFKIKKLNKKLNKKIAYDCIQNVYLNFDDNQLKEYYANLLMNAMNVDNSSKPLNAFLEILKNISPDEAKLLEYFRVQFIENHFHVSFPILDFYTKVVDKEGKRHGEVCTDRNVYCLDGFKNPSYIENFQRLGIVDIIPDRYLMNEKLYTDLEQKSGIYRNKETTFIKKKMGVLTNFGEDLLKALSDK